MHMLQRTPGQETRTWTDGVESAATALALHPWNGLILTGIAVLIGSGAVVTAPLSYVESLLLGLALSVPVALVQRLEFDDTPKQALAKGLLALLVTVPSPLAALVTLVLGIKGAVILLRRRAGKPDAVWQPANDFQSLSN